MLPDLENLCETLKQQDQDNNHILAPKLSKGRIRHGDEQPFRTFIKTLPTLVVLEIQLEEIANTNED